MKYVKLTAKPDTWFKEGTEVYDYDCRPPDNLQRMTLEHWERWISPDYSLTSCLVRGRRVADHEYPYERDNFKEGEEYWDGDLCSCDEFNVEIVEEER